MFPVKGVITPASNARGSPCCFDIGRIPIQLSKFSSDSSPVRDVPISQSSPNFTLVDHRKKCVDIYQAARCLSFIERCRGGDAAELHGSLQASEDRSRFGRRSLLRCKTFDNFPFSEARKPRAERVPLPSNSFEQCRIKCLWVAAGERCPRMVETSGAP